MLKRGPCLQALPSIVPLVSYFFISLNTDGAVAAQIDNAQEGLRLAREVCARCHDIGRATRQRTNAAAPSFSAIANMPGMTNAALAVALQTSHKTMPNIVIKGDDANNIAAYILNLKSRL
jgi:mono/diheme cytochrome c family protein